MSLLPYLKWGGGRAVEGARLEIVYTLIAYRGFKSLSPRQKQINNYLKLCLGMFVDQPSIDKQPRNQALKFIPSGFYHV